MLASVASALVTGPHAEQVLAMAPVQSKLSISDEGAKLAEQALKKLVGNTLDLEPRVEMKKFKQVWGQLLSDMPEYAEKAIQMTKEEYAKESGLQFSRVARQDGFKGGSPRQDWDFGVQHEGYGLRGKKADPASLGLDTVNTYTGYFDVNEQDHLFYWFFESRNDPKNDPVIMWMNGGPGCASSATGLMFELGPSSINKTGVPSWNPHAWNSNASVIFLDQPVNVGYSYESDDGKKNNRAAKQDVPGTTRDAAKHVYRFLKLFFSEFKDFQDLPFHIFTESYGGHYGPGFASEILRRQEEEPNDGPKINLASLGIGNGIVDPLSQVSSYYDMACTTKGGYHPVLNGTDCQSMLSGQERCKSMTQSCYDLDTALVCVPALLYCDSKQLRPYTNAGYNPYDVREICAGNSLCYEDLDGIDKYLNDPKVQEAIGAEPTKFEGCNNQVGFKFSMTGDGSKPFHHDVAYLLNHDIPVLVYAGDKDFICNWLGNREWVHNLDGYQIDGRDGKEQMGQAKVEDWQVAGEAAGTKQNVGHFTFLRVYDAGHMVPYNKGPQALSMVNAWLAGDYALKST